MSAIAFGDESHIHAKDAACYGIGCFLVPVELVPVLEEGLSRIFGEYKVEHELKWNRISDYRADLEVAFKSIEYLLKSGATFHSMIVEKSTYKKWKGNREEAFYTTYYQLAIHVIAPAMKDVELRLDYRSDKYPKQAEVLGIIANHALKRIKTSGFVSNVRMIDSKSSRILQTTDVLLGAITSDTNSSLTGTPIVNQGKLELIQRVSALVGWTRLHHDTWPNTTFNVWHFPLEFRAKPGGTRPTVLSWQLQRMTVSQ